MFYFGAWGYQNEVVWDPVKNPWNKVKNAVVQISVRNCLDGKK